MTVQPGSLDNLYYNGILDHIPYEAYTMPTSGQGRIYQPAYDPKYLDNAKKGYAYQYNGIDTCTFQVPGSVTNYEKNPWDEFKTCMKDEKNKFKALPLALKGLLASGVIATTFALLFGKLKHK